MSEGKNNPKDAQLKQTLQALVKVRRRLESVEAERHEPIAVVGMSCRLPGAENLDAYWRLLESGETGIREVPAERWEIDPIYDPEGREPGKLSTRRGGFCDQDYNTFDTSFFGIAPREAEQIDAQQRLFMEVAWEAMEDAGWVMSELAGSQTGIFLGVTSSDQQWQELTRAQSIDIYTGTGNASSVTAGRLAYLFDLRGPAVSIDTACSSSLVAVHLACRSLRSREADRALVGGVYTMTSPLFALALDKLGLLSKDGFCRPFDAQAGGTVASEGCGVLALKRLNDAQAEGDRILALIRGSAANQDGRSAGLTAPNLGAQEEVIRKALADARLEPQRISHIEAHGTGTPLGDPVELEALDTVYGRDASAGPCWLGATKGNIGHTMTTAGVAGLIKLILSLRHEVIPPVAHFERLNPHVEFKGNRLEIADRVRPWPSAGEPRRAAISSFGWSGTNAHVIVEEAPHQETVVASEEEGPFILTLSGRSPEARRGMIERYRDLLASDTAFSMVDLCYTANQCRTHHEYRLVVVGATREDCLKRLSAKRPCNGRVDCSRPATQPSKLAFVYSGQGAQWAGMGLQLMLCEPVFAEVMERCDQELRKWADWSLLDELRADEADSRLDQTEIVQPAIFAIQLALTELWKSWGIEPKAVVGHSVGEIAAAHVAGVLTFEEAIRLAYLRGRAMQRATGGGKMVAVQISVAEALERLRDHPGVELAAINAPESMVFSGPEDTIDQLAQKLESEGIEVQRMRVDYAFHSCQMEPAQEDLRRDLEFLQPRAAKIPLYSTVTGACVVGSEMDADYWARGIRSTVRFAEAVESMIEADHDLYLEIAPHRVLAAALRQILRSRGKSESVLASMRRWRDEPATIYEAAGALHTRGYELDFDKLQKPGRLISLPGYAWQRRACRRETVSVTHWGTEAIEHPLLGQCWPQAEPEGRHVWQNLLDLERLPYLQDHRVEEAVVVPGSLWAEMGLAAAALTAVVDEPRELVDFDLHAPLVLIENAAFEIQTLISPSSGIEPATVQIFSRPQSADAAWRLHASGKLRPVADQRPASALPEASNTVPDANTVSDTNTVSDADTVPDANTVQTFEKADFYRQLAGWGLRYGPAFQGLQNLKISACGAALGELIAPDAVAHQLAGYRLHPALLDACFQVAGALIVDQQGGEGRPYMPVHLGRLRCFGACPDHLWSRVRRRENGDGTAVAGGRIEVDIDLIRADGECFATVEGLVLQRVEEARKDRAWQEELFRVGLESSPGPEARSSWEEPGSWLIVADRQGVGEGLAAALREVGEDHVLVSVDDRAGAEEALRRAVEEIQNGFRPWRGLIYCRSLDASFQDGDEKAFGMQSMLEAVDPTCLSLLLTVKTVVDRENGRPPSFFLLTRGAMWVASDEKPSIAQAMTLGMARSLASEHPELRCKRIDLASEFDPATSVEAAWRELRTEDEEGEVALRPEGRFAARLERQPAAEISAGGRRPAVDERRGYRLETLAGGLLDALTFVAQPRQVPAPHEVEIEVAATGLNFSDVMKAMGLYPGLPAGPAPLGIECAGRIVAIGDGVEAFRVGDEVITFGFFTMASHVTVPASLVTHKPSGLSLAEAATLPVTFGTAYHALCQLGGMQASDKVLIHSATGGVGQAAIQLARRAGAEIFATAGTEEKRQMLRQQGIQWVMDSRRLDFASEVMQATDGRGVDLILNSLAGEAIGLGLSILAPGGRFLEIGKRDIHNNSQLGLLPFKNHLSFFAIDLDSLCRQRPQVVGQLLRDLAPLFEAQELEPLPHRVFAAQDVQKAFRGMARAQHTGKWVIAFARAEVDPAPPTEYRFERHATHLITGGLGGLGLTVAEWMADRGARHLVLLGRSAPRPEAEKIVGTLRSRGVEVRVESADVADHERLFEVLDRVRAEMPPLRGIVHAAGLLRDGMLALQTEESFIEVLQPKVAGAWNLHLYAEEHQLDLDYFALFSSISAVVGTPGQANYAAGNAFLDALAQWRRSLGKPALSINWGPWAEVGMAAGQRLAADELLPLAPPDGVAHLERLLVGELAQVAVVPLRQGVWPRFVTSTPLGAGLAAVEEKQPGAGKEALIALLRSAENGHRQQHLENYLRQEIARALQQPAEELDIHQPLVNLGLDSLMAVEIKNRIAEVIDVNLPMSRLLLAPSLVALAEQLMGQVDSRPVPQPVQPSAAVATDAEVWEEITL